jgi:hypothetical protein
MLHPSAAAANDLPLAWRISTTLRYGTSGRLPLLAASRKRLRVRLPLGKVRGLHHPAWVGVGMPSLGCRGPGAGDMRSMSFCVLTKSRAAASCRAAMEFHCSEKVMRVPSAWRAQPARRRIVQLRASTAAERRFIGRLIRANRRAKSNVTPVHSTPYPSPTPARLRVGKGASLPRLPGRQPRSPQREYPPNVQINPRMQARTPRGSFIRFPFSHANNYPLPPSPFTAKPPK